MYKMCGKCGFFYDDVENPQCPQCGEASDVKTTIGNQPTDINEDYSAKCPNCGNVHTRLGMTKKKQNIYMLCLVI